MTHPQIFFIRPVDVLSSRNAICCAPSDLSSTTGPYNQLQKRRCTERNRGHSWQLEHADAGNWRKKSWFSRTKTRGLAVGRKLIQRLMHEIGIQTINSTDISCCTSVSPMGDSSGPGQKQHCGCWTLELSLTHGVAANRAENGNPQGKTDGFILTYFIQKIIFPHTSPSFMA